MYVRMTYVTYDYGEGYVHVVAAVQIGEERSPGRGVCVRDVRASAVQHHVQLLAALVDGHGGGGGRSRFGGGGDHRLSRRTDTHLQQQH